MPCNYHTEKIQLQLFKTFGLLIRRSSVRATHNPPEFKHLGQSSGVGLFAFGASVKRADPRLLPVETEGPATSRRLHPRRIRLRPHAPIGRGQQPTGTWHCHAGDASTPLPPLIQSHASLCEGCVQLRTLRSRYNHSGSGRCNESDGERIVEGRARVDPPSWRGPPRDGPAAHLEALN